MIQNTTDTIGKPERAQSKHTKTKDEQIYPSQPHRMIKTNNNIQKRSNSNYLMAFKFFLKNDKCLL